MNSEIKKHVLNLFLGRTRSTVLVLCGLWVVASVEGAIIPSDRLARWQGNVGVVGGIPDSSRMTVFRTIPAGASAETINSAIAACPSNQVVQLSAGTYPLTAQLRGKTGVVLRGAGMANTILVPNHHSYGGAIYVGAAYVSQAVTKENWNGGAVTDWTAGYAQGSSNITLSSVSTLVVGNTIVLDQTNDTYHVNTRGYQGDNKAGRGQGKRALQQYSRVTAINGNVVTIWPPIAAPFWSASLSPQAWWIGSTAGTHWVRKFGIEDLTLDGTELTGWDPYKANIYFETARDCWIKNVKSLNSSVAHVCFFGALNCEVRGSVFYGTKNASSMSYGILPIYCSWMLIEDNVFEKIVAAVITGTDASCSVMAYNYVTNSYYVQANNFLMPSFATHNAHSYMWLMEGNYFNSKVVGDFLHGSSSHNVFFRNRIRGYEDYSYPGGPTTANLTVFTLEHSNRVWSVIGNILGQDGIYNNYEDIPSSRKGKPVIYQLGIEVTAYNKNWGHDREVAATFYRHMNFDFATDSIVYNPTNADVTLPNSLYLASKPAFFGSMPWPPYNPTNTTAAAISWTNIPAGFRYGYMRAPEGGPPPSNLRVSGP